MKRCVIMALAVVAGIAGATAANEPLTPSEQAIRCWLIPAKFFYGVEFSATFDVDLDEDGDVQDITVTSFSPETEDGKEIVRSASRAIEKCSPYNASGRQTFTMLWIEGNPATPDSKDRRKGPIDPFK